MTINMNTTNLTIEQITDFLNGTTNLVIIVGDTIAEKYQWSETVLTQIRYQFLKRSDRTIVRRYLCRCTAYSLSHIDHCIAKFKKTGRISRQSRDCSSEFSTFYEPADITLLAQVSEAYFHPNGKALKEVLHDMYHLYGDERFERLSHLSVSRLYDFRKTRIYQETVLTYTKTKSAVTNIGERKKPYPEGKPGFLRVDSVHQGDLDKQKGVYHVHLVDEVLQWDVQLACEGISEFFLLPVLKEALHLFPFHIVNFHSDNGSEYINKIVAGLLDRLMIKQTKSRSRRTNDNALIEGKHAATVRPVFGRSHIPKKYASSINVFNREQLIPFLNFHRKCAFPTEEIDARGKIKKVYREFVTPVEKLLSIPNVEKYLKKSVTIESLEAKRRQYSHLEAAEKMQKERTKLFNSFKK